MSVRIYHLMNFPFQLTISFSCQHLLVCMSMMKCCSEQHVDIVEVTSHLSALQRAHSFKAIGFSSKKLLLDRITIDNNSYTKTFYVTRCVVCLLIVVGFVVQYINLTSELRLRSNYDPRMGPEPEY